MQTIHIFAARELIQQVEQHQPVAVLSIEHPGVAADHDGRAPRLYAEHNIKHVRQYIQSYYDTETPHRLAPSFRHVNDGLFFLQENAKLGTVAVHCRRGKSRSVAMGIAFLVATNPQVPFVDIIEHVKKIRPIAAPNILIIQHTDKLFNLRGELTRAVLADKQLTAAREEANAKRAAWAESNPDWENVGPDLNQSHGTHSRHLPRSRI